MDGKETKGAEEKGPRQPRRGIESSWRRKGARKAPKRAVESGGWKIGSEDVAKGDEETKSVRAGGRGSRCSERTPGEDAHSSVKKKRLWEGVEIDCR